MLFHSHAFLFVFLPACFAGFVAVHRLAGPQPALWWLAAASFVFYGQWHPLLALLLAGSVLFNYGAARLILWRQARDARTGLVLAAAIAANLTLLGYFKYANFLLDNLNLVAGTRLGPLDILLPVGISFYSFAQIGMLVEVHSRQVRQLAFGHYVLFASFFPCVTAGPIVVQRDMLPQFREPPLLALDATRAAVALSAIAIGLFKKLVFADNLAPFADGVFDGAAAGAVAGPAIAWIGALAYTLQLYFDFSAYSDMALGSAFLFGLRLPLNFNSPLKATSITDFWRRWHMTMTRFFTNYLYAPAAMTMTRRAMRRGLGRWPRFLLASALPVTFTFVLAGLWHGAGWTFVVFGLIHGVALAVNHAWREAGLRPLPTPVGWCATMAVVVVGLVFFRAADLGVALALLASMAGFGGAAATVALDAGMALAWIAALGLVAVTCPNSQEILRRHWYSSDPEPAAAPAPGLAWPAWRPSPGWGLAAGLVTALALGSLGSNTTFLYYQF